MTVFFDTNVLVYAQQAGAKGDRARALLAEGGKLSVQVLNEFAVVSFRKLAKSWPEIASAIDDILVLVGPPEPVKLDTHVQARNLSETHRLSFYDALVIAAARAAGCTTLFSEDMQDGRSFGDLRLVNPFR